MMGYGPNQPTKMTDETLQLAIAAGVVVAMMLIYYKHYD
jgi:hypothetical protein